MMKVFLNATYRSRRVLGTLVLTIFFSGAWCDGPRASTIAWMSGGHADRVRGAAVSPDGVRVATASADRSVKIWLAADGTLLRSLPAHPDAVFDVAFSPDGAQVATACRDGVLRLFDADTGLLTRSMAGHEGAIFAVAYSPNGQLLASGGEDDSIRIWQASTGMQLLSSGAHGDDVLAVAFSPNGQHFASASADDTVKLWLVGGPTLLLTIAEHADDVRGVAFSPDSARFATVSLDATARIYAIDGSPVATLGGHYFEAESVAYSPDGQYVVTGDGGGHVRVWSAADGSPVTSFLAHQGSVYDLALPNSTAVVTAAEDRTWKRWDLSSGSLAYIGVDHMSQVTRVAFDFAGQTLASASVDNTIRIWNASTGMPISTIVNDRTGAGSPPVQLLTPYSVLSNPVVDMALSPDGQSVAAATLDQKVRVWDVATAGLQWESTAHQQTVTSIAFSADGSRLVSGDIEGHIRTWTASDGTPGLALQPHDDATLGVCITPDGSTALSAGRDGKIVATRVADGVTLWSADAPSALTSVAVSPGGSTVACGSVDKSVRVYQTASGALFHLLVGHGGVVDTVAYAADGLSLYSGSQDGEIRHWQLSDGSLLGIDVEETSTGVRSVACAAQGGLLAVGREDGSVAVKSGL